MELRYWLIAIGIVVIVAILFDGWRRMRGSKGKLKFRLDRSFSNLPDGDPDLGQPRVVEPSLKGARNDEDDVDLPSLSARELSKRGRVDPHQGDLDLDSQAVEPIKGGDPDVSLGGADQAPTEEVLVINVIARDPNGFKGPALLQNILESGLRFGEMDIFHRHESMSGNGEVLFSMANGVKPGTFNLDDIDHFSTRAVSFFLGLPGPRNPKQAFEVMVTAARKLANELDGELKDDQRSVLTGQTVEHYRQRVVEFERRELTLKR